MANKLYIRNLGHIETADKLEEMFSSVGDVVAASMEFKTIRDKPYRVAYVTMATAEQATEGIERFHGFKTNGDSLVVTLDIPHVSGLPKTEAKSPSQRK